MSAIVANVCFLLEGEQVILARKKRTLGIGLWNGYGGKVESGESVLDALVREVEEESCVLLDLRSVRQRAVIRTYRECSPLFELHIFVATRWEGQPQETEEHGPAERFSTDELPYSEMFPADELWLPLIFSGEPFEMDVYLSEDGQNGEYVVWHKATFS